MRRRILICILTCIMLACVLCGCNRAERWLVTCPWAPSGVAALVSERVANTSPEFNRSLVLEAEAIKGDATTVNMWVNTTIPGDQELVFAGEGLFAITHTLNPEKLDFTYEDFVFVENLYSSIFIMCASSESGVDSIASLEEYAKNNPIKVAVNGATSSEAFLAAALFGEMGVSNFELIPFSSAKEAADAVVRKEADFAIAHQAQILDSYKDGSVNAVCAFSNDDIKQGTFKGVEGVGKYGYPYFMNRCFIMCKKGTSEKKIAELKALYRSILQSEDITEWLHNEMLLEVDVMEESDVQAHIRSVKNIVSEYKDVLIK